jgi:hypothetical protein
MNRIARWASSYFTAQAMVLVCLSILTGTQRVALADPPPSSPCVGACDDCTLTPPPCVSQKCDSSQCINCGCDADEGCICVETVIGGDPGDP